VERSSHGPTGDAAWCVCPQGLQTTLNLNQVSQCPGWDWTGPVANPGLVIRSSGTLHHTVYHSTRRNTSGAEFTLELGTSQMKGEKKHYEFLSKICHAVNMKQLLFVDQKPITVSHKTGMK